jgi:hypothetical protein
MLIRRLIAVIAVAASVSSAADQSTYHGIEITIEGDPLPEIVREAEQRLARLQEAISRISYTASVQRGQAATLSFDAVDMRNVVTPLAEPVKSEGALRVVRRGANQLVELRYHQRGGNLGARDLVYLVKDGRISHFAPEANTMTIDDVGGKAKLDTVPSSVPLVRNIFDYHLTPDWWRHSAPYNLNSLAPQGKVVIRRSVESVTIPHGERTVRRIRVTDRFAPPNLSSGGVPLSVEREVDYDPDIHALPVSIIDSSRGRRKLAWDLEWKDVVDGERTISFPVRITLHRYARTDGNTSRLHDQATIVVDLSTLKLGDAVRPEELDFDVPVDVTITDTAKLKRMERPVRDGASASPWRSSLAVVPLRSSEEVRQIAPGKAASSAWRLASPIVFGLAVAAMVPVVHILRSHRREGAGESR